jgi:hypothetical protein
VSARPAAAELLHLDGALVTAEDVRTLSADERAVDRTLRGLPEIVLPGVARIYYPAEDVRERLEGQARAR